MEIYFAHQNGLFRSNLMHFQRDFPIIKQPKFDDYFFRDMHTGLLKYQLNYTNVMLDQYRRKCYNMGFDYEIQQKPMIIELNEQWNN